MEVVAEDLVLTLRAAAYDEELRRPSHGFGPRDFTLRVPRLAVQ